MHNLRFFTDRYIQEIGGVIEKNISVLCEILEDETSRNIVKHICRAWELLSIPEDYFCEIERPISEIYFDEELPLPIFNREISFVDCGAYIGDTVTEALSIKFKKVFMFELDKTIYDTCNGNMQEYILKGVDIRLYPFGVSDSHKVMRMTLGNGNSRLVDCGGDETGETVALDDILIEEDIDFIKMDIEGEELNALKGAERILKSKHPALAICLYHKPEDMFSIPQYIKSIDSSYKIYIRHYSSTMFDTVCYAI